MFNFRVLTSLLLPIILLRWQPTFVTTPNFIHCIFISISIFTYNFQVIELVIDNWDEGEHPIHLHGRRVYVMARGAEESGPFANSTGELNEVDPILRDVVTVSATSYIGTVYCLFSVFRVVSSTEFYLTQLNLLLIKISFSHIHCMCTQHTKLQSKFIFHIYFEEIFTIHK